MLNLQVYFGRPRLLSPSGAQSNMHDIQLLSKGFVLFLICDLLGIARSVVLYFNFQKHIHCYYWCDFAVKWEIFGRTFDFYLILLYDLDFA